MVWNMDVLPCTSFYLHHTGFTGVEPNKELIKERKGIGLIKERKG